MRRILTVALFVLLAVSCGQQAPPLTSGIELANMDTSIRPQDDFFRYVNGTWLDTTEIPADRTNTGVFMDLRDKAREDVKAIIEEVASKTDLELGSDEQKVADLYNSFMDTERLEELGMSPLESELELIDSIGDKDELSAYFARSGLIGAGGPFNIYIWVDAKDATRYVTYMWQSGIGLPDRDYYFKEDDKSIELREAYVDHIEKMFELLDVRQDVADAEHATAGLDAGAGFFLDPVQGSYLYACTGDGDNAGLTALLADGSPCAGAFQCLGWCDQDAGLCRALCQGT